MAQRPNNVSCEPDLSESHRKRVRVGQMARCARKRMQGTVHGTVRTGMQGTVQGTVRGGLYGAADLLTSDGGVGSCSKSSVGLKKTMMEKNGLYDRAFFCCILSLIHSEIIFLVQHRIDQLKSSLY